MHRRVVLSLAALFAWIPLSGTQASDHKEAPLIQEDPSADISDIYAFVNPNNANKLVLAMTVNPFSVPSEAVTFHFSPNVRYVFHVDNDDNARSDVQIIVTFGARTVEGQTYTVRIDDVTEFQGVVTQPTEEPEANPPIITRGGGGVRAFAGPRDDPFFFDVVGFFRFLSGTGSFTGSDGFAGFNTSAIVIEIPFRHFGGKSKPLQIWGETARRKVTVRRTPFGIEKSYGPWSPIERAGNPAIATALIPFDLKDAYNIGKPKRDARDFADAIVASLQSLGTNDENIAILASVAVPDTLKIDARQPTVFPNGRGLSDDVIDSLLFFIFNQQEVPDGVDENDVPFEDEFPFLAAPHQPD